MQSSCELLRQGIGDIFKLSTEVCRVLWEVVEAWNEVESQLDYRRTDVRKYRATSSQLKTLEIVVRIALRVERALVCTQLMVRSREVRAPR